MTARLIRQSNRGQYVEYEDGTTAPVESERVRAARHALICSPWRHRGTTIYQHQLEVMDPLRAELRAALAERIQQLMEQETA